MNEQVQFSDIEIKTPFVPGEEQRYEPQYGKVAFLFVGMTVGIVFGSVFGSWCATSNNVSALTKHDFLQMVGDAHQTKYKLMVVDGEAKQRDANIDTWIKYLDKAKKEGEALDRNLTYRVVVLEEQIRKMEEKGSHGE